MAQGEKLPWELTEEILSRVLPKSLVRFRTVSKQWNALFDDKTFVNNHKTTFRFILGTKSNIYTVSIDPEIVARELTLDIPGLECHKLKNLVDCDEFLLCGMDKGAVVWNPWLKQTRWIKVDVGQPSLYFEGSGYYNNRRVVESVYKTIAFYEEELNPTFKSWKIHDFASDVWKDLDSKSVGSSQGEKCARLHTSSCVSLNGSLYWIAFNDKGGSLYYLINFDFSRELFFLFCHLPCGMNHCRDALVLRVFRGDRFSLLKQCHVTKKIEIWVTKNKINYEDGDDVVWRNFMTFSIPNLPALVQTGSDSQPSYFIDDKRLVVCSCDETGRAWIYVLGENKLISKTRIDSVVDSWPLHCTFLPSLVPVPPSKREET